MLSCGEKITTALVTCEFLLGSLVNGFIVLVNCIDWVKNKKLAPSDLILLSLAIARIGLSCAIISKSYLITISSDMAITHKLKTNDIFLVLTHNSNIWFATILSVFYFLKITTFSNPLFLWMKWRIDRMVFMLLWGPLILSLVISFPLLEQMYVNYSSLFNEEKERNVSQEIQMSKHMFYIFEILLGLVSFIPFALSTISLSLLILSLWRHNQQMQFNATSSRDPCTEAHVRAMKAVSSLLILLLLYYIGFFVNYWNHSGQNNLPFKLSMSIMLIYPFGHSVILILWNSKLRKAALRVSWMMSCCREKITKSFGCP